MRRLPSLFLALFAVAAATGTAQAQHPTSRHAVRAPSGIMINAHLSAMPEFSIGGRDFDTPSNLGMGPAIGAQIGYAVDPRFLIYAGADLGRLGAAAEDPTNHWSFTMLEVGGRMSFPAARRKVTPYVTASVGTRSVKATMTDFGNVRMSGMALTGGGGITYQVAPAVAVNAAALVSVGKYGHYEDPEVTGSPDLNSTTSTRLQVGLDWRP
jgi:Outer membrane protein beta-barrel domain